MRAAALLVIFILSLLTAPLAVEAQQAGKVYRVCILRLVQPDAPQVEAFRQALRQFGYVDLKELDEEG
jgi:hypothetical protein